MQAQGEQCAESFVLAAAREDSCHALVHFLAVEQYFKQSGAREQSALRTRLFLADAVIVGIEQHPEHGQERPEGLLVFFEDEGLEKPGGMAEVPLDRARL